MYLDKMPCSISDGPDYDDWLDDRDDFEQVEPDDFNDRYYRERLEQEAEREREEFKKLLEDIGRLV